MSDDAGLALWEQRDYSLRHLDALIRRARELRDRLASDADDQDALAAARIWQRDCAAAVNELSGGSKAHWLARAFSSALLVRRSDGSVVVEAPVAEIVDRVLDVLAQARGSLLHLDASAVESTCVPVPVRFDFVHEPSLRPVLERAFADSRSALARGEYATALILSCGAIEALLTDALEARGKKTADLSFDERIAAAERAELIRGGCARLPASARRYRELADATGEVRDGVSVSEKEARTTGQVLRVIIRDLDPGR